MLLSRWQGMESPRFSWEGRRDSGGDQPLLFAGARPAQLSPSAETRLGKKTWFSLCAPPITPRLADERGASLPLVRWCWWGERPRRTTSAERGVALRQPWPMQACRESDCV